MSLLHKSSLCPDLSADLDKLCILSKYTFTLQVGENQMGKKCNPEPRWNFDSLLANLMLRPLVLLFKNYILINLIQIFTVGILNKWDYFKEIKLLALFVLKRFSDLLLHWDLWEKMESSVSI